MGQRVLGTVTRGHLGAVAILLLGAASAAQAQAVDQEQPLIDGSVGYFVLGGPNNQQLAQVFTAGRTGLLAAVEFPLSCSDDSAGAITLEVRNVEAEVPGDAVLSETTFQPGAFPPFWPNDLPEYLRRLTLSEPLPVTAGVQYALVLQSLDASCGLAQGPEGESYSGGDGWYRDNGPWGWGPLGSRFDLPFRTLNAMVINGAFAAGTTGWLQFATPDMSYIVSQVTDGVFEFYRRAPPPGTRNQAVVFQETGTPLAAGTALVAQFSLGNSDTVRKRISVLIHDSDFSDLSVCTFWLPANLPLTAYTMRTHNTKPWNNATISFYSASTNAAGNTTGFYRLDDVMLSPAPAQSTTRTDCVDPNTPAPPGGADGPELLVNGTFGSGAVAPGWSLFGQIQGQVTGGVFEFLKLAGTPAGVILQPTSQPMSAGQRLTATFQLGNSSPTRKRVTVILHDNDFSDLSACTFWLAPNQPLSTYTYRTFATQTWANATLSVYPATVGAEQWIRLDNVTLRRTPSSEITGIECLEPDTSPDDGTLRTGAWTAPQGLLTPVEESSTADATSVSEPTDAPGQARDTIVEIDEWIADGFERSGDEWLAVADAIGRPSTLTRAAEVDLTTGSDARLTFESWLSGADTRARVEVSLDGDTWLQAHAVDASDTWVPVEVDLSAWRGVKLRLRLVLDVAGSDAEVTSAAWRVRGVNGS
jgi:hypothetical protein